MSCKKEKHGEYIKDIASLDDKEKRELFENTMVKSVVAPSGNSEVECPASKYKPFDPETDGGKDKPFNPRTKRAQCELFIASILAMNPNIIDMRNKIGQEDGNEMTKEDFDRIEKAKLKRARKAKKREDERIKRCQK